VVKKIKYFKVYCDKEIGKGAFSTVYLGEDTKTKQLVAVKELSNKVLQSKLGERATQSLEKELVISQTLKHQNIVRTIDFFRTENNNYFVFEYCGGGDLRTYLREHGRFSELEVQRFMKQIADALRQLYLSNVVHRDLKLQNILLTEKSPEGIIKLADFGLARNYQNAEDLFETACGTPIYMAPEIQKGDPYGDKADLWSVGIIMFELLAGYPPFIGQNKQELRQNIERGIYRLPTEVKASTICLDLIQKLLKQNSAERISWLDFFEHPFVKLDPHTYQQLLIKMGQIKGPVSPPKQKLE